MSLQQTNRSVERSVWNSIGDQNEIHRDCSHISFGLRRECGSGLSIVMQFGTD